MKQTAIINGKTLDRHTNTLKILNLVIGNKKIIGQGYIPDDDDSHIIDISNSFILPEILPNTPHDDQALSFETLQTDLALQNTLQNLLDEGRITHITCSYQNVRNCLDFCFNDLLKKVSLQSIVSALTPPKQLLTKPYLGLLSQPNFYVVKPNTTPCLVLEVKDGTLIQSTPNT